MSWILPLLLVPVVLAALYWARRRQLDTDANWRQAASKLNGHYTPRGTSFFNRSPRTIIAKVSGVHVRLDHFDKGTGEENTTFTRIRIQSDAPSDFRLRILGSHMLGVFARLVGFQDVSTGDLTFDKNYIVKSNTPEIVPLWLNERVRQRIDESPSFDFSLSDGNLLATKPALLRHSNELLAATRAAVAIVNGRRELLKSWNKVASDLGGTAKAIRGGLVKIRLEQDGATVGLRRHGDNFYTSIIVQVVGKPLRPFVLSNEPHRYASALPQADDSLSLTGYHLWCAEPHKLQKDLAGLADKLVGLELSKLRVDAKEVSLLWKGIEQDPRTIKRMLAFALHVSKLAQHGPYR